MFYLITYSQRTRGGNAIPANEVININPAQWLIKTQDKYPEAETVLLFALEISEEFYQHCRNNL